MGSQAVVPACSADTVSGLSKCGTLMSTATFARQSIGGGHMNAVGAIAAVVASLAMATPCPAIAETYSAPQLAAALASKDPQRIARAQAFIRGVADAAETFMIGYATPEPILCFRLPHPLSDAGLVAAVESAVEDVVSGHGAQALKEYSASDLVAGALARRYPCNASAWPEPNAKG